MQNKTVIICCAGMGKRLGIGTTKALLNIDGKPLIIRLLECFDDIEDVRIVVGYQATKLISVVQQYRKDVIFVFNHNYSNSGPGDSAYKALIGAKEYSMIIDGDLVINPTELKKITKYDFEFVCGSLSKNLELPSIVVDNDLVSKYEFSSSPLKWIGIVNIKTERIKQAKYNVFEMLSDLLPLNYVYINAFGINTMDDYENATCFVKNNYKTELVIGVLGGMGTYATINLFNKYAEIFPAEKEWERPRIIIDNNCTMPSRVRAYFYNEGKDKLIKSIGESLENLVKSGANKLVLACNTSHLFLDDVYKDKNYLKTFVVSIIDTCVEELVKNNEKKVLLLATEGTISSNVYQRKLESKGIEVIAPDENEFPQIRECIEAVKQNKYSDHVKNIFASFLDTDLPVILGCTELPVLYDRYFSNTNKKVYDPLELTMIKLKENYYD